MLFELEKLILLSTTSSVIEETIQKKLTSISKNFSERFKELYGSFMTFHKELSKREINISVSLPHKQINDNNEIEIGE